MVRFYGGTPATWLTDTPIALVRAHVAMLPRLRAEESLRAYEVAVLGGGLAKKEDARRVLREWETAARGGERLRVPRATVDDMRAMGIVVRTVPKRRKGHDDGRETEGNPRAEHG